MASLLAQGASKALRTISTVLPQHTKRLVLWSSLYSKMHGGQTFTAEQSNTLNGALALCKDQEALALPAMLGKFIAKDLEGCMVAARKAIRGEKTEEAAAAEFLHSVPSWLRYASDALVLRDFRELLATHRRAIA
jgi:hypothetical protein